VIASSASKPSNGPRAPPPIRARRGARPQPRPRPITRVSAWLSGDWRDVPLYVREDLRAGETFDGPALLAERRRHGWIAPGWTATVEPDGHGVAVPHALRHGCGTRDANATPDPLRLEIFNGLFMHVAEQMGVVLRRPRAR